MDGTQYMIHTVMELTVGLVLVVPLVQRMPALLSVLATRVAYRSSLAITGRPVIRPHRRNKKRTGASTPPSNTTGASQIYYRRGSYQIGVRDVYKKKRRKGGTITTQFRVRVPK